MSSGINNYKVYIDISATDTPDYEQLCVTSVSFDLGENLDTWYDLCSAYSNSEKVSMDPTFGLEFKFAKTDPVAQFIMSKEYATGAAATAKVKIVNLFEGTTGKQIDFTATLSNIAYEPSAEEVLVVSLDLKPYRGTTFVKTDYTAPSV